ncbi:MAG: DUF4416 family protein [Candidatus Sumerlaeaceae bacterium]|nr:DUF4416 family protein [Candidatus Sumerlaeaceae bacterium]
MGALKTAPQQGKLFFGLIATSEEMLEVARKRLALDFSAIETQSPIIPFDQSNYYEAEMGSGLLRQWISTERPIFLGELPDFKRFTNKLEDTHGAGGKRTVNIDPGYVNLSKVVLATTKDYEHRIFLGGGIFAEVTLHYRRPEGFVGWPWTYPDHLPPAALSFFGEVREKFHAYLNQGLSREA